MRRLFRWLFPRRKQSPWVCRGPVLGHSWTWVPETPSPSRNVYGTTPAFVRCRRCCKVRPLGVALDFRRAVRVVRTFRDGSWVPIDAAVDAWNRGRP